MLPMQSIIVADDSNTYTYVSHMANFFTIHNTFPFPNTNSDQCFKNGIWYEYIVLYVSLPYCWTHCTYYIMHIPYVVLVNSFS